MKETINTYREKLTRFNEWEKAHKVHVANLIKIKSRILMAMSKSELNQG